MNSQQLYHRTRRRAKKLNVPFNLTPSIIDNLTIPLFCPILNIPLLRNGNEGRPCDNSLSIDRINNSKGYVEDNVVFISYKANRLKSNATLDELKKISEFYDNI